MTVLQGYGATETGTGSSTTARRPRARDGRARRRRASRCASPTTARSSSSGPTVFRGYWNDPDATAAAFTDDGWYKTGDIGHLDAAGRLILSGRIKDIIVLPNGFNVYPEDIENALRIAGIRDSVVLETQPGRIEAVVLGLGGWRAGGGRRRGSTGRRPGRRSATDIDAAVKAANATPRPEPADRRLAALAGRGLPADAHAQGQARPGPRVGRGRHAAAGRRDRPSSGPGSRPRASRAPPGSRRADGILRRARQPAVVDDRRADLADDRDRPLRASGRGPARSPGTPASSAAAAAASAGSRNS